MEPEGHEPEFSRMEGPGAVQSTRETKRKRPDVTQSRLSKDNLEQHNQCVPQADEAFGQSTIYQERARAHAESMYHHRYGKPEDSPNASELVPEQADEESDEEADTQPQPASNDLKLYNGPRPSAESPMRRFLFPSPATDAQPWLAKQLLNTTGIGRGDMDSLAMRRLAAAEYCAPEDDGDETDGDACSSPSMASMCEAKLQFHGIKEKATQGIRIQRSLKMRRGHTARGTQGSRSTQG